MNPAPVLTSHQAMLTTFALELSGAIQELKDRLQARYERLYPTQAHLVHTAIEEAELRAWQLSSFPHLFLPDLVEARLGELALQPALAHAA